MMQDIQLRVGQIYPDPDRPLRFTTQECLDRLAQSMATIGQIHPVIVCREGLRWLLVCGERRLEAARRLGWERIAARPIPYAPPALRAVVRTAENLHRRSFSLIEMIDAAVSLREAGTPVRVVAQAFGREIAWAEALLAMSRDPVARVLLEADRISSVEAWEQFMELPPAARQGLLGSRDPITRERCERAARQSRRKPARSSAKQRERGQGSHV